MSLHRVRAFAVAALSASLVFSLFSASLAHAGSAEATPYLEEHAGSPWVVMALSVVGDTPDTAFLQSATSTVAIELEAPILALTAAHKDPRVYPASDLIQGLQSHYSGGQIGDPGTLNDDIFGILALVSAGVSLQDEIITGTRSFVLSHQNTDGGWPFTTGGTSDTNTTAAAIMALIASGGAASDASIVQGLDYLHAAQNTDGGFPYDPQSQWGTGSDASSDAWVMLALSASGVSESSWATASGTPMTDLLSYQQPSGYFEFQHGTGEDSFTPVTTSYAVLALSGKTLPVAILPPPPPPPPPPPEPTPPAAPAPSSSGGGGGVISGPFSIGFTSIATTSAIMTPAVSLASTTLGIVLGTSTELIASTTPEAVATTSEVSPYQFTYNLQYGMRDAAVFELQKELIAHNLLHIILPTGWFGPLTRKAVTTFQEQNEIPPTGIVGPMTRASLNVWKL